MTTDFANVKDDLDEDLNAAERLLRRAADTLVEASTLRKVVAQMRTEVDVLQTDVRRLRDANALLDETVTRLREERNNALDEARKAKQENETFRAEATANSVRIENLQRDLLSQSEIIVTTRRERDDAQFRVEELTEELARYKARLESVQKALNPVPTANYRHDGPVEVNEEPDRDEFNQGRVIAF